MLFQPLPVVRETALNCSSWFPRQRNREDALSAASDSQSETSAEENNNDDDDEDDDDYDDDKVVEKKKLDGVTQEEEGDGEEEEHCQSPQLGRCTAINVQRSGPLVCHRLSHFAVSRSAFL